MTTTQPKSTIRAELRDWYRLYGNGYYVVAGKLYGDSRKRIKDGHTYYTAHIETETDKPNESWVIFKDDMGFEFLCFRDKEKKDTRNDKQLAGPKVLE